MIRVKRKRKRGRNRADKCKEANTKTKEEIDRLEVVVCSSLKNLLFIS